MRRQCFSPLLSGPPIFVIDSLEDPQLGQGTPVASPPTQASFRGGGMWPRCYLEVAETGRRALALWHLSLEWGDSALLRPPFQLQLLVSGQRRAAVHAASPVQPEVGSRDLGCLSHQWWQQESEHCPGAWS